MQCTHVREVYVGIGTAAIYDMAATTLSGNVCMCNIIVYVRSGDEVALKTLIRLNVMRLSNSCTLVAL